MKNLSLVTILILAICPFAHAELQQDNPLKKLEWLVGKWSFSDVEINGDYLETGTRDCELLMNDSYIVCTSIGRAGTGPDREYIWYFNYNDRDNRHEMVSVFSSYPRKLLYEITPNENGHTLNIVTYSWEADGFIEDGKARVIYNGTDEYIWDGLNGEPDPQTGAATVSFRDTVTRK